jgi:hypothetical protein
MMYFGKGSLPLLITTALHMRHSIVAFNLFRDRRSMQRFAHAFMSDEYPGKRMGMNADIR